MQVAEKNIYTETDYQLLEEGAPFQLINGNLVMSPSPLLLHQLIIGNLYALIRDFLQQSQIGGLVVLSPMDVKLNENNIFQPDLLYITEERKAELIGDRINGAPDLIIEILSPSTAYYDLRQKKDFYERYGVKEYLIIDPVAKDAEVYLLTNEEFMLKQKQKQTGTIRLTVLPGLEIDLQKLFA